MLSGGAICFALPKTQKSEDIKMNLIFKNNTLSYENGEIIALFKKKQSLDSTPDIYFNNEIYFTKVSGWKNTAQMMGSKETFDSVKHFFYSEYDITKISVDNQIKTKIVLRCVSQFKGIFEIKFEKNLYVIKSEMIFKSIINWEEIKVISGVNDKENLAIIVFCIYILKYSFN